MIDESALQQEAVLRRILKARAECSLFAQLGLKRLANFKDFETLYTGFARAVPVQGAKVFMDSLAKMLPQGEVGPLQVLQNPHLLVHGKPLAACLWENVPVPVTRPALQDHLAVERYLKAMAVGQGVPLRGKIFYLFEQEPVGRPDDAGRKEVVVAGWHQLLEGERWFWERERIRPSREGLPKGGSRWQWFDAMHGQMKTYGKGTDMLVTHPKTLIDFSLYVSQQSGRYVTLKELLPDLRMLVLNNYEIGLQRAEMRYLLAGLPDVRWIQWIYNGTGMQAWQSDMNIRQRLDMMSDGQAFYEFVPVDDVEAGGRLVRNFRRFHAGQLELGREYMVVVSSLSGLLGVATGQVVRVVSLSPLQVVAKGPVARLNGLGEGLREDMVVEALGNLNAALTGHGVFVRDALFGHDLDEHLPQWVLEISRPMGELAPGVLESMAKRVHAELAARCAAYQRGYQGAVFRNPQVNFVPMGTFAAAFATAPVFSHFDHSADAALVRRVLGSAWESRSFEAV